jgi:glycosyltransferase involved in cell wall biosynthesis
MAVPSVSIVIPTRDRPNALSRLLQCVQKQTYENFECLVVDDGSTKDTNAAYDTIWRTRDQRFRLHLKTRSSGAGRARNTGIKLARGKYVAFCDDDDVWIRDDHLLTSVYSLEKYQADLFFANMQSSSNGVLVNPDMLSYAAGPLRRRPLRGEADLFGVARRDLSRLLAHRILHSDTLVAEKRLLIETGMYWEKINFAEDCEISFRLADKARRIIFRSTVVGDLEVADHPSISRTFETKERLLFSIFAALRAETVVADPALRRAARTRRAWEMLRLAQLMAQERRRTEALELAVQSLLLQPSGEAVRIIGKLLFRMKLANWRS